MYLKTGRDRKYKIENEEICKLVQSNHGHVEHDGLWGCTGMGSEEKKVQILITSIAALTSVK